MLWSYQMIRCMYLSWYILASYMQIKGVDRIAQEISPCCLYRIHNNLNKAVFLIALFPKAVSNISKVSCLEFWFATQHLITDCCSRAAILLIRMICVTRFCITSKDVKIGIVMSLTTASNQGHCLDITQYRK